MKPIPADFTSPTPARRLWEEFLPLPSQPGVYWWLDGAKKVLYVGKAKNLKNRLVSYRQRDQLTPKIAEMIERARYLQFQVLPSELEALLIEAQLINIHQPPYNTLLKDDKSPLYIVLTREAFPRVLRVRRRDLARQKLKGRIFGPYPSSYKVSEVLKIIRPIFPWCNVPRRKTMRRCLENHLGLCAGVCTGSISQAAYQKIIDQLALFLAGKTKTLVRQLKQEMQVASANQAYEQAQVLRDQLQLITEVTSSTKKLRSDLFLPNLLSQKSANALVQLRQILSQRAGLPRQYLLRRIEGYDVSNTSGQEAVVSMVVFEDAIPEKSLYRSFNIRTLDSPNDFAMLAEALGRRVHHSDDWGTPSLILIDGGKGQVRSVCQVLHSTIWQTLPVIGIAKDPDRLVIPTIQAPDNSSKRLKISWQVLTLSADSLALQLVQQIRDEAHRFGKSRHIKRRQKKMLA